MLADQPTDVLASMTDLVSFLFFIFTLTHHTRRDSNISFSGKKYLATDVLNIGCSQHPPQVLSDTFLCKVWEEREAALRAEASR